MMEIYTTATFDELFVKLPKMTQNRAAAILETVSRGNEIVITKRGKSIAILKPFDEKLKKEFSPVGFGLWKNRKDMKDVTGWVEKRRKERFQR